MSVEPDHKSPEIGPKLLHAFELIFALCVDQITEAQARELESLVSGDPEICDLYIDIMHLKSSLHRYSFYFAPPMKADMNAELSGRESEADQAGSLGRLSSLNESMVLPAISNIDCDANDENSDTTERFDPAPAAFEVAQESKPRSLSPIIKGGIAALTLLTVGLLGYVVFSRRGSEQGSVKPVPRGTVAVAPQPSPPTLPDPVATMNFTQKPVWATAFSPPMDGRFFAGQTLGIESGVIQLSFQAGGHLVIEGPAEVEFVSRLKIDLHRGKIVATIPGGGLVVGCPNGSVTDLGTQFGMEVNSKGATEIAVFQGRVSAALTSTATTQGSKPMLLDVGQAAVISPTAIALDEKGAMPQRFVCNLVNTDSKTLDVPDLIGGGDGTTHRRGIGINPKTGAIGNLPPVFSLTSDGQYHRVSGYPFIDGAFIADVGRESMIVDSAGDKFHVTGLGNTSYNYIYTGGKIPWPDKPAISTVLDGVDYSTGDHGMICIHPNNGLTLDLNAVRRIYPDMVLKSFHCRVGISGSAKPKDPKIPDAAVSVLLDGSPRFQNQHFTVFDGSFEVNVPLKEADRFMTLVSTYSGPGNYRNWVLWVDAKLDLAVR